MIDSVVLEGEGCTYEALAQVLGELGADGSIAGRPQEGGLVIGLSGWKSAHADLLELDTQVHARQDRGRPFGMTLVSSSPGDDRALLQVLTRYQRLLPLENRPTPLLDRALAAHRLLFDLRKPLVRADYDHALDTWRWLLRIDAAASPAVQLAALFHDVERLLAEADGRVEHLAIDYDGFKHAHARVSGRVAARALEAAGMPQQLTARARALIEAHESPNSDPELSMLNDADALSFLSLNGWGFVEYFGVAHTRKKVAYTLRRMTVAARRHLPFFRHHPVVASLLDEIAAEAPPGDERGRDGSPDARPGGP